MHERLKKYPVQAATLALALLSLIWGYNWVIMKLALRDAGAFEFAALRTALGAACLFALLIAMRRPLRPGNIRLVLLLGLLQTTGFIGLTVWALESGAVGKSAVLAYIMPFWVLLLAWPLLHEKIRGMQWLAVCAALTGLLLLLQPWSLHGNTLSMLLAVLAGVCWAASAIVAKKLQQHAKTDVLSVTAWQMLLGGVPLVLIALAAPGPAIHWSGYFVGALAYNAILASALAWLLWLYALNHLPAGSASLGMLATPAISVLTAGVQLNERPTTMELFGMLLIGAALTLVSLHAIRQHRRTLPAMGQE